MMCVQVIVCFIVGSVLLLDTIYHIFQFILPAIVHINNQPYLNRGDGPIVRIDDFARFSSNLKT